MRPFAAVLVAAIAALPAQGRLPAFVTVTDAAGRPVAGATVTCVGGGGLFDLDTTPDVVEIVTDPRGRALPRLLPQRRYAAFAWMAQDGSHGVSPIVDALAAGRECTLGLVRSASPTRFAMTGADAWQAAGPLRVVLRPDGCDGLALPLASDALPPVPAACCLEVRDAHGATLWSAAEWTAPSRNDDGSLVVTLPPPQELGVRVVDGAGRAVADAALWRAFEVAPDAPARAGELLPRPVWRSLGRTGADGLGKVSLAVAVRKGLVTENLFVEARVEGYALGQAGTLANFCAFSGRTQMTPPDGVLPITLAAPEPLRVHPPGEWSLIVRGKAASAPTPRAGQEGPVVVRTGADGKGRLPLVRDIAATRLAWIGKDGEPAGLAVVEPEPQGSFVMAPRRRLRLVVTDALGSPARGQVVTLGAARAVQSGFDVPFVADQAGHLEIRIGRGAWFAWCRHGDAMAWYFVEDGEADVTAPLAMQTLPLATVRVVDRSGKPCAGRTVTASKSLDWKASGELSMLAHRQFTLMVESNRCSATDAQGRLTVPMLPLPGARLGWQLHFGSDAQGQPILRKVITEPGETSEVVVD